MNKKEASAEEAVRTEESAELPAAEPAATENEPNGKADAVQEEVAPAQTEKSEAAPKRYTADDLFDCAMPINGENILECRGLCKMYSNFTALYQVDFSIPKGGIVGLLGPNGSGKRRSLSLQWECCIRLRAKFWWTARPLIIRRERSRRICPTQTISATG